MTEIIDLLCPADRNILIEINVRYLRSRWLLIVAPGMVSCRLSTSIPSRLRMRIALHKFIDNTRNRQGVAALARLLGIMEVGVAPLTGTGPPAVLIA